MTSPIIGPIIERLSYRIGRLSGRGFPWDRKQIALLTEAREEIFRLETAKRQADIRVALLERLAAQAEGILQQRGTRL